ncbi:MAG: HDIG domain-containing protein [Cyanobacteria bacterium SID2]|nr:HDIG domain-containing protein [Cyanobacteria bacterium SID2]MBP0004600.1 HDIG domain-containing protein [Cyanobacteria bacterium SBC]
MKALQSLTRQIECRWQWWRERVTASPNAISSADRKPEHRRPQNPRQRSTAGRSASDSVSAFVAVLCLTGAFGQRFYNQPELGIGSRAPQTIVAPESVKVEDTKTTDENRRKAEVGATRVLTSDPEVNTEVFDTIERYLEQGNALRDIVGEFPYAPTGWLSTEIQRYLRECSVWEWQAILWAISPQDPSGIPEALPTPETSDIPLNVDRDRLLQATRLGAFNGVSQGLTNLLQTPNSLTSQAVRQLQITREKLSAEDFAKLLRQIETVRQLYTTAIASLSEVSPDGRGDLAPPQIYTSKLFDLSDVTWQETQQNVLQVAKQMLVQGIAEGVPPESIETSAQMQLSALQPSSPSNALATALLVSALKPNLVDDPEKTRERAEQAAQDVQVVFVTVERGQVIVEAGESITRSQFVLLDHFNLVRRDPVNGLGWIAFGSVVWVAVSVYGLVEKRVHPKIRQRDRLLMLLLSLSAPLTIALNAPTTSLPAIGLAIGSFYGPLVGSTVVALLGVLLPLGLEIEFGYLLSGAISGILGGVMAGRLRSREELALLGVGVGIAQALAFLVAVPIDLLLRGSTGPIWSLLLETSFLQGLWGVAWSILVLGVSPYLEHLFDLVTPVRLAELSNPNRPLLKRLAAEAPGTFQHTLFVSTLAESAAKALGCNVELVRAGTLYHDIGKMHDPLSFVENQMGGPNKHDRINDPWKSAAIIQKHVSEGLVMARKSRLPKAIQAFIPEHQGTMLIAYFYYQAKHRNDREVREQDFRYDGPIPQSRETGIVMLADSCEAALRSLKDATPEEAFAMVNKILRARWQDNQLVDSGLTRADMSKIAEIFVQVWQQFNHKRIAYPKAVLSDR